MARKKIGGAVVPYSGKVIPTKGKLVHQPRSEGIKNLGGIAKRAHARAKFRHDSRYAVRRFRASAGAFRARSMYFGDRFFRYFTLFLVCLVLFAVVTGANFSLYKNAVESVYVFTESVSDVAQFTMQGVLKVSGYIGDFKDYIGNVMNQETLKDGQKCIISVKIKGTYYDFQCTFRDKNVVGVGVEKFVINKSYGKHDDWVNKEFLCFMGFLNCPDMGFRVYKIFEYIEVE